MIMLVYLYAFLLLFAAALFKVLKIIYRYVIRPRYTLWRQGLPSAPPPSNIILGGFGDFTKEEPGVVHLRWKAMLGSTFRYAAFMQTSAVLTFDKVALVHVSSDSNTFEKPHDVRTWLSRVLGEGLVTAEGSSHARQRKIMNPSFGPAQLKAAYPLIVDKAIKLRDNIAEQVPDGPERIDMHDYSTRAALDVIAAAGFGYESNAIQSGGANELVDAFETMIKSSIEVSVLGIVTEWIPSLQFLTARSQRTITTKRAHDTMNRIGAQLLEEKKAAIQNHMEGKDLLSLLVKANLSEDVKPSTRMLEKEIMAQISTFIFAGNDTTASALSWSLYALAKNPLTQSALRDEIVNANISITPSYDELSLLEYLDAVVRETLRLHAPLPATARVATRDTVIPLGEPYTDNKGLSHDRLRIAQGTVIMIPILGMNRSESIWGPDALHFRPERWLGAERGHLPDGVLEIPSINFPTFFAGSHACIGFRLSLAEMKIMLYLLIQSFQFELIPGEDDIKTLAFITTKPGVRSKPEEGPQLPLRVTSLVFE